MDTSSGVVREYQYIRLKYYTLRVLWEQTNRENLTKIESEAFRVMRSISDSFKSEKTKKEEKSFDLSSLVDYPLKLDH